MRLRKPRRDEPEVNLLPLIDVVFLLLIFFMISTTFQREAQLRVDLPQASQEPSEVKPQTLELTINANGDYFLDQRQVLNNEAGTLKRALQQWLRAQALETAPVIVRADGRVSHQAVVTAMDVLGQLGLARISLATVQSEDRP